MPTETACREWAQRLLTGYLATVRRRRQRLPRAPYDENIVAAFALVGFFGGLGMVLLVVLIEALPVPEISVTDWIRQHPDGVVFIFGPLLSLLWVYMNGESDRRARQYRVMSPRVGLTSPPRRDGPRSIGGITSRVHA